MALIKLYSLPHPDLNGGRSQPVYIDASRVLLITRSHHQHPKIGAIEAAQELHRKLYEGTEKLNAMVNGYVPKMDDPTAVGWMRVANNTAHEVCEAYRLFGAAKGMGAYHPMVECTEVQLACGTALEHGVMLTRVWVTESPEQVADLVQGHFAKGFP